MTTQFFDRVTAEHKKTKKALQTEVPMVKLHEKHSITSLLVRNKSN